MTTSETEVLSKAQTRATLLALAHRVSQRPITAREVPGFLSGLMKHGGLYSMLDPAVARARLSALVADGAGAPPAGTQLEPLVGAMRGQITDFFSHLVQDPYEIPSSLMSHIALPHDGVTYSAKDDAVPSPDILAAFTFVGQFVDHDLTMNALDLFLPQTGSVEDVASPLIDLDSVYGPRSGGFSPAAPIFPDIFDGKKFKLNVVHGDTSRYVDIPRIVGTAMNGTAIIADKRNDENQLLLQVHLLIMRFHNHLIDRFGEGLSFDDAYRETLFTWQSILRHDYLPKIAGAAAVDAIEAAIQAGDFSKIQHVPLKNVKTGALSVTMPHEFAIAFRFGHSQLRTFYPLQPGKQPVRLFDNSLTASEPGDRVDDLRGSQLLRPEHVIDWAYFLDPKQNIRSNLIDDKVTRVVFDLPESTIPDDIKYIGNLPHRNLIRSRQVGLCSGEDLAEVYGKAYGFEKLTPLEVEPKEDKHHLYEVAGRFRTPLWFYILREAQLKGQGRLGPLGSHLVSEVILGGIYYNHSNYVLPANWQSKIFNTGQVTFHEFATYVAAKT